MMHSPQAHEAGCPPHVLVVDDDAVILGLHTHVLRSQGFTVSTAENASAALAMVDREAFDVILTDLEMPGLDGLALMESVRARDLDVPVVLITGAPTTRSAIDAVEKGALRYLVKPVPLAHLVKVTNDAVKLHRLASAKRRMFDLAGGEDRLLADAAGLAARLQKALDSAFVSIQPIVSWAERRVYAYECLLRSNEPSLPHPGVILDTAERVGRVLDVGRVVRRLAAEAVADLPPDALMFVNLHPSELDDPDLSSEEAPLTKVASRVVLEVTERSSLDRIQGIHEKVAALRRLGFRIALDDLGAGYAGLTSFSLLEPEVVKLDMGLVRDLTTASTRFTLVRTMVAMCKELGMLVVAEGIETPAERDALVTAGCDLLQGYLFARPKPAPNEPTF